MKSNCYLTFEESSIATGRSVAWIKKRLLEGTLESTFKEEEWLIKSSSLEDLCGTLSLEGLEIPPERVVYNFLSEEPSSPYDKAPSLKEFSKQNSADNVNVGKLRNKVFETQNFKSNVERSNTNKKMTHPPTEQEAKTKPKSKKTSKKKAKNHIAVKSRTSVSEEKRWHEYQARVENYRAETEKFKEVLREVDRQIQRKAKLIEHSRGSNQIGEGKELEQLQRNRETLIAKYKSRLREIGAKGIVIEGAWEGISKEFSLGGCGGFISQKPNREKGSSRKQKSKKRTIKVIVAKREPLNTFDPRRKLEVWEKPRIAGKGTYQSPSE